MNSSKKNLRPKRATNPTVKSMAIADTFRKDPGHVARVKTSLALNEEKYNQLRIYAVTHKVQLKDIFDEAMDLYIAKHLR